MSRKTIRVLIVDDHAIVREGYRALLAKHEGITVVGEACDAASAYHCYKDSTSRGNRRCRGDGAPSLEHGHFIRKKSPTIASYDPNPR
jgi:hypothetical protein